MRKFLNLLTILLAFFILFLLSCNSYAATANLSANKTEPTVGDTVTVTVKINAAQWNLSLTANGKVINSWVETQNYKENLSKSFTTSYKTSEAGKVEFVLSGDITDVNQQNDEINEKATITVKAKTNTGGNTNDKPVDTPKEPIFKSANKTVYTTGDVNLRSSWSTSSSATTVKEGTELTLTGTSTETINGYVWYRVTYKGATKYVAKSLITETKPKEDNKDENKDDEKPQETDKKSSNKSLSSLSIEGIELTPKFNKETTKYTAKVDGDVTELKINYKAEDSKAKVAVEGNKDLKEGDNVIKVKVTAEDDTTRTYFITVTKGEGTEADTSLKLSELKIERVNFEDTFKPDTYTYELSLNTYVKKLDITATPNQADAKVEITGNDEFKAGKNMVIVLLTSADGKQTATYQIEVNLPEEVIVESQKNDMEKYVVTGIAIFIAIIIAVIIVANLMKKRSKLGDEDEEVEDLYEDNKEDAESSMKDESNEKLDNSLNNSDNENREKNRKSKGRHSM